MHLTYRILLTLLLQAWGVQVTAQADLQRQPPHTTQATIVRQVAGDAACYLTLREDTGRETTEMAEFDLCAPSANLQGKKVQLTYAQRTVMDPSCGGDPTCKRTRAVGVVVAAKVVGTHTDARTGGSTSKQASFCTPTELTVFACHVGAKLVSVCAYPASRPGKGYLQYRYGKPDSSEPLELTWPLQPTPPSRAATGGTEAFSGGGAAWLRFRKGDYAYVVFTGVGRWGANGATVSREGIVVERGTTVLTTLKCSQPVQSELGPNWYSSVGIVRQDDSFDIPD